MDINNQINYEEILTKFVKNTIQQEIEFYQDNYTIKFSAEEINKIKDILDIDKMIEDIYNLIHHECYYTMKDIEDERKEIN